MGRVAPVLAIFATAAALRETHSATARSFLSSKGRVGVNHTSQVSRAGRGRIQSGRWEQLEKWEDHHRGVASIHTLQQLLAMGSSITPASYEAELHAFTDPLSTRFVGSEGNEHASTYIAEKFRKMGLTVYTQEVGQRVRTYAKTNPQKKVNVFGLLRGGDMANDVQVIGGHFDSVNWPEYRSTENVDVKSPGVDDNGSGIAAILQVAKTIASHYNATHKPRRSVLFAAFNAEEEGLHGSEQFVTDMNHDDWLAKLNGTVRSAILLDEVAWPGRSEAEYRKKATLETKGAVAGGPEGSQDMLDTFAPLVQERTADRVGDGILGFYVNYHGFSSDHMSFLNHMVPAVLLIERDDEYHADNWGHSNQDDWTHVDMEYGSAMARLALRCLVSLANPATRPALI